MELGAAAGGQRARRAHGRNERPVRPAGEHRRAADRRLDRLAADRRALPGTRRVTGSPVVRLNGAVAVAEAEGPAAALAIVDALDLDGYQYWHSTRGELLRRMGRAAEARAAYRRALDLAASIPERRYLQRRIDETLS